MTRDEYVAVFKNYIAHPFGGNGVPTLAQMGPIFDAFLQLDPLPPFKRRRMVIDGREVMLPYWSEDDDAIMKVACFVHADLETVAKHLGRKPTAVIKHAWTFRPKIIPTAWARAYKAFEVPHR